MLTMKVSLCSCLVLVLLSARARGQCDEGNCSEVCLPVQWQRELCIFYIELEDWRVTALRCGLVVPSVSPDRTLTASDQWEQAREHWNTVRDIWQTAAEAGGVLEEFLAPFSGSGMESTTPTEQTQEEVWQEELGAWLGYYDNWKEFVSSQGLSVPTTQYPSELDGSDWIMLLTDWSDSFTSYNETYYGVCPLGR